MREVQERIVQERTIPPWCKVGRNMELREVPERVVQNLVYRTKVLYQTSRRHLGVVGRAW